MAAARIARAGGKVVLFDVARAKEVRRLVPPAGMKPRRNATSRMKRLQPSSRLRENSFGSSGEALQSGLHGRRHEAELRLRVLVLPRGDPLQPLLVPPLPAASEPAFAKATLSLQAMLIPSLDRLPEALALFSHAPGLRTAGRRRVTARR